jgi:uncharacterized protein (TIGR02246 family)
MKSVFSVGAAAVAALAWREATSWLGALLRAWVLTTAATLIPTTVAAETPSPDLSRQASAPAAEIARIADAYSSAILAGDARELAGLFAIDGSYLPPHQPAVKGRLAIQHHFEMFFKSPARMTGFSLSHFDTTVEGDVAYDVGTSEQRLRLPDGKTASETSKYVAVLKRIQGRWLLAYLTYNSDSPSMPCSAVQ